MVILVAVAHKPAVGVNVYTVEPTVDVDTDGLQVPEIPLLDMPGSTGTAVP